MQHVLPIVCIPLWLLQPVVLTIMNYVVEIIKLLVGKLRVRQIRK